MSCDSPWSTFTYPTQHVVSPRQALTFPRQLVRTARAVALCIAVVYGRAYANTPQHDTSYKRRNAHTHTDACAETGPGPGAAARGAVALRRPPALEREGAAAPRGPPDRAFL